MKVELSFVWDDLNSLEFAVHISTQSFLLKLQQFLLLEQEIAQARKKMH